jgi:cation transport ATPase
MKMTGLANNDQRTRFLSSFLLTIFLLGMIGAAAELLLLGHTEDWRQWVPLALFLLSLFALLGHAVVRRAATLRIFQATMLLFIISGAAGCWFHYQAKREFKLEANPALAGWELFREAIVSGAVPPVLAPGLMIQLGLIGLAYGYCRPSSSSTNKDRRNRNETT